MSVPRHQSFCSKCTCYTISSPRKRDLGGQPQSTSQSDAPLTEELEDKEYQLISCTEEVEDESTIEEEERLEGLVDHEMEVNELKEEGNLLLC